MAPGEVSYLRRWCVEARRSPGGKLTLNRCEAGSTEATLWPVDFAPANVEPPMESLTCLTGKHVDLLPVHLVQQLWVFGDSPVFEYTVFSVLLLCNNTESLTFDRRH